MKALPKFLLIFSLTLFALQSAHAQETGSSSDFTWTQEAPKAPAKVQKPYRAFDDLDREDDTTGDYLSQPQYNTLVYRAIQSRPKKFEFGLLRSLYTRTSYYDPIGQATTNKVLNLAYTIENDPDPKKRKEAFDEYGTVITEHMANIDVISQALVLSENDRMYGDPSFYKWMRAGLLRDIVYSGNGKNLAGAYDVMTLGEESFLMNALRFKVLKTDPQESGGVFYNMHLIKDPKYDTPYWIYVDVTQPMRFLKRQQEKEANTFTLRPQ